MKKKSLESFVSIGSDSNKITLGGGNPVRDGICPDCWVSPSDNTKTNTFDGVKVTSDTDIHDPAG